MHQDIESDGDPRYYLPQDIPIITPERAAKGDVLTGPPCTDCNATGKVRSPLGPPTVCKHCRGRGWIGSVNAATIAADEVRFAQIHEVNLLNNLWEKEHITDQQHHDGQTFRIWRDMHRAQMGLERPVSSGGEEAFGVRLRAYGFVILLRQLNRHDCQAIETALLPMMTSWTGWIVRNRVEKYLRAFERLSRVLPPVKERIAYLEGLSEDGREEMSREGMKILLETIKN